MKKEEKMKFNFKFFLIIILFIILINLVSATTYYVDYVAGSDSSAGTSTGTAWKHAPGDSSATGNPASTTVIAGDTIYFKGGVSYNGSVTIDSSRYNSGTAGNLINLKSGDLVGWGTGRAVLDEQSATDGTGGRYRGFSINSRNYIHIEGFEIKNVNKNTDSAGIWLDGTSTYCEFVGNLIHEIYGTPGSNGYGIELTGTVLASYILVEKNEIYHTEEKAIETYRNGNCTIRYNFLHNTNDHCMVISSSNNVIYGNIFEGSGSPWMSYESPFRAAYCMKFAGAPTVPDEDNKLYNNLFYNCSSGIGILSGKRNYIVHNTVYYSGFQGGEAGGDEGSAFVIRNNGDVSYNPDGNVIENNIFYYSHIIGSGPATLAYVNPYGDNNQVKDNVVYYDASHLSVFWYWDGSNHYMPLTDFEGTGTYAFSSFGTGNVASGNVVVEPNMNGGTGTALLAGVPTGFDVNWHPNTSDFALTSSSPSSMKGATLSSPYDVDIQGNPRTQWWMGAYEYVSSDTVYPTFSTYLDNNGSLSGSGIGKFNVTLANTNGTVLLEINGVNVTAKNLTDNVFNASYNFSTNGTYSYHWDSWGNGSSNNFNVSNTQSYTVNFSGVFCASNTYYIDFSNGNDSNNGTCSNSAWKHAPGDNNATGNPASTTITAGTTIYLKGGVSYNGSVTIDSSRYNSGSAGNLINLKSGDLVGWGTGRAVLDEQSATDGTGGRYRGFTVTSRDYIHIEGFEIKNVNKSSGSAGIQMDGSSTHCEFVGNLIHDIYGTPGDNGYGIELTGSAIAAYTLVEKNTIYHTEEKAIELYENGNCIVRYNYLYQTNDHALVISSSNNVVYDNIIHQSGYDWMSYESPFAPAFGIKVCGWEAGDGANNNTIYNNLLWDCDAGIGLFGSQNTTVYHNTVYYSGFRAGMSGGQEGSALSLTAQSPGGSCTGDIVENNIFYYSNCNSALSSGSAINFDTALTGNNNIVQDNLAYMTSGTTGYLFIKTTNQGFTAEGNVTWFEGASGLSSVGSGNIASGNVMVEPNMSGGTGTALLAGVPTGFDVNWHPNTSNFALTSSSPSSMKGVTLSSTYNVDIQGNPRTQWWMGAYEYNGTTDSYPTSILSYPANNNVTNKGVVTFQCNATDDWNLENVTLYVWNSSNGLINKNSTSWTGTSNSTTFTYNFTFYNSTLWNCLVYDNASQGSWASSNRSLNIAITDSIYPLFSTYWDNNGSLVNNGTGLFNVTLTNTNGTVFLEINGVNVTAKNLTDNVFNASYTFSSSGTYSYHWDSWGNGSSNNFNVSNTRSYTINSAPPNINFTSPTPANNTNSSNKNLNVNYTATDSGLGLNSCWYSNDSFTVNSSLPSCSNISTIIWSDGTHNVIVYANDTVGNVNYSSITFGIDTTPPYFTNLANQNLNFGQPLNYDINANDDGVGVQSFAINWTNTFSIDSSGVLTNTSALSGGHLYYINVSVNDTVGNLNSSILLINVSADTTPPVITLITPSDGSTWSSSSTVTFTYTVSSNNDISNCSLILNSAVYDGTGTVTKGTSQAFAESLPNGNYTWNVNCTDAFNNQGNSSTYSFTMDYTAPSGGGITVGGGGGGGGTPVVNNTNTTNVTNSENNISTNVTNILTPPNTGNNRRLTALVGFGALVVFIIGALIFVVSLLIRRIRRENST